MGVNWAACLIRWQPHVRRNGERLSLSHLHPFRFEVRFAADGGRPPRVVEIQVGFTCHVFTCDIDNAGTTPELYSDKRETRAFDEERYNWSFRLKGILTELEKRKCYFARREHFVTFVDEGVRPGYEYRVFFTVRRKNPSTVELLVQSAYIGRKELRPRGQSKQPIGFRAIVTNVILQRALTEAR